MNVRTGHLIVGFSTLRSMLVDTHAHLYLDQFDDDRPAVVQRARDAGVDVVVMPAIDVSSIQQAVDLCEEYDGLYAMTALHPSETEEATEADFAAVKEWCDHPSVVAVGESGLDYYWDRSFDDRQQSFFRRHIRLAIETDLPLDSRPGITEWDGESFDPSVERAHRIYPHHNDTGGFFCAKLEVTA